MLLRFLVPFFIVLTTSEINVNGNSCFCGDNSPQCTKPPSTCDLEGNGYCFTSMMGTLPDLDDFNRHSSCKKNSTNEFPSTFNFQYVMTLTTETLKLNIYCRSVDCLFLFNTTNREDLKKQINAKYNNNANGKDEEQNCPSLSDGQSTSPNECTLPSCGGSGKYCYYSDELNDDDTNQECKLANDPSLFSATDCALVRIEMMHQLLDSKCNRTIFCKGPDYCSNQLKLSFGLIDSELMPRK